VGTTCDSSGEDQWATFDINGDSYPDLVVTDECFTGTVGTTQWAVYLGTGSAFATTATSWSLPTSTYGFPTESFAFVGTTCDSSGEDQWATFDITGDGLPDLVVTDECFTGTVGTTQWAVYENTGSGFASTAITWTLPTSTYGFPTESFAFVGTTCDSSGEDQWATFDIDGDGLPDLVVTDECFTATVGTTQWAVYKNTGSGFASTATTWSLPTSSYGFPTESFTFTGTTCDATGEDQWGTFDINGDGLPDLVVTDECFTGTVGTSQWAVYENTGSGFSSTATAWALPPSTYGFPTQSFVLTGTTCDATGELQWDTLDIDGDGHVDLVVTDECFGTTVGLTEWDVYKGGASGFATTASCFPLPSGYSGIPWTSETLTGGCDSSDEIQWSTLDMNGDKKPDLAVTERCFDANVGVTRWNVHLNER
jgi:hypothetical protein